MDNWYDVHIATGGRFMSHNEFIWMRVVYCICSGLFGAAAAVTAWEFFFHAV